MLCQPNSAPLELGRFGLLTFPWNQHTAMSGSLGPRTPMPKLTWVDRSWLVSWLVTWFFQQFLRPPHCGTTSTEQAPGLQSYGQDEGGTAQLSGQPSGGFWTGQGLVNAPLFSFSRILISLNSVIYVGVNIHAHVYMIYIYTLHIKYKICNIQHRVHSI